MIRNFLLIIAILCLCGCSVFKEAKKNNEAMLSLNAGQTKEEVLKIMGNPAKTEKYFLRGVDTDIWYYRTAVDIYGIEQDNFTPIIFEDGELIGWGKDYYQKKIAYRSELE